MPALADEPAGLVCALHDAGSDLLHHRLRIRSVNKTAREASQPAGTALVRDAFALIAGAGYGIPDAKEKGRVFRMIADVQ
ncbi:MAG TPA: hypothetical protein VL985_04855 [Stellaceae bacterium]|nr:hypothetical protein [Stellaceae bacterium]